MNINMNTNMNINIHIHIFIHININTNPPAPCGHTAVRSKGSSHQASTFQESPKSSSLQVLNPQILKSSSLRILE